MRQGAIEQRPVDFGAAGRVGMIAQGRGDLAFEPARLVVLRREQRACMAASPVCDSPRFARHLQAGLRSIWQSSCASGRQHDRTRGERRMNARPWATAAVRALRHRALCIAACLVLLAPMLASPALANDRGPVKSLLEMRRDRVVVQEWDLSCGAAALATLLHYQHGDPVSEREIAKGLIGREEYIKNPGLVRIRQGFSLLDLKRYVDSRGYRGIGYGQLTLQDLIEQAPILVPISSNGYNHFVVFRGARGNRVLLADPAFGNHTMLAAKFEKAWLDYEKFGKVGFVVARADDAPPPNRLDPAPSDFVSLR
jgi:predicted double-glycine peptidase